MHFHKAHHKVGICWSKKTSGFTFNLQRMSLSVITMIMLLREERASVRKTQLEIFHICTVHKSTSILGFLVQDILT